MIKVQGIPVSPGYAIGNAFIIESESENLIKYENLSVEEQLNLFENSLSLSKKQLAELIEKGSLSKTETDIINFQREILDDESFCNKIREYIKSGLAVDKAIQAAFNEAISELSEASSSYLRERVEDLKDLMVRLLKNLSEQPEEKVTLNKKSIVVAKLLTPSAFAYLDKNLILGIITEEGGTTSHVAIMAKERGIPMIVGIKNATYKIKNGDLLILDGYSGTLIINPTSRHLDLYKAKMAEYNKLMSEVRKYLGIKATTKDGVKITVQANVGNENDLSSSLEVKADGIGLLRTEFLYLERETEPSESELIGFFKKASEAFPYDEVIIRTLDVGGDKFPKFMKIEKEANPFLGVRGIRLTLKHKKILKNQLKAIILANSKNNLKIMLPMISDYNEVVKARKLLNEVISDLKGEVNELNVPQLGIMVETPAAALMTDVLSEVSDFFSIGTNDLTQYMLAVDRENKNLSYLYDDMHPSVLRAIKDIVIKAKKPLGVCGEMASEPLAIPLLIGLGVRKLSVNPPRVLAVKMIINEISQKEAEELAESALDMKTASKVRLIVKNYLKKKGIKLL